MLHRSIFGGKCSDFSRLVYSFCSSEPFVAFVPSNLMIYFLVLLFKYFTVCLLIGISNPFVSWSGSRITQFVPFHKAEMCFFIRVCVSDCLQQNIKKGFSISNLPNLIKMSWVANRTGRCQFCGWNLSLCSLI